MKKYIITIISTFFLLTACQHNDLVVSPDKDIEVITSQAKEPNWLVMPERNLMSMQKSVMVSDVIRRNLGGSLTVDFSYTAVNGNFVQCYGEIIFPEDAWLKRDYGRDITFTMELDDETASATFTPHVDFVKPPILNLIFSGLDLSSIEDETAAKFVYQDPDGTYEEISYELVEIDTQQGLLKVVNASIPHFSRFGFLN